MFFIDQLVIFEHDIDTKLMVLKLQKHVAKMLYRSCIHQLYFVIY